MLPVLNSEQCDVRHSIFDVSPHLLASSVLVLRRIWRSVLRVATSFVRLHVPTSSMANMDGCPTPLPAFDGLCDS